MSVKTVWDAFTSYCYLPRLRDEAVFVQTVQEGIAGGEYFAYATSVSANGRYEGLKMGALAAAIYLDAASVLAKPDAARAQIEAERAAPGAPGPPSRPESPILGAVRERGTPGYGIQPAEPKLPRRFFGIVEIDPDRVGRDMGRVAEEILQHLITLPGGKVRVTDESTDLRVRIQVPLHLPSSIQGRL